MTYLDGKLRVQGTHVITAIREFCRANPNGLQSTSHTTELVWYAMREELPGFYKLDSEPIGPVQGAVWKHETIQKFADYSLRVLLYEGDVLESDPEIHFHVGVHTCGPLQQVHKVRCIAPSLMVPGQIEKSAGDHGSIKTNSRLQVELRSPTDSALLDCPRGPPPLICSQRTPNTRKVFGHAAYSNWSRNYPYFSTLVHHCLEALRLVTMPRSTYFTRILVVSGPATGKPK